MNTILFLITGMIDDSVKKVTISKQSFWLNKRLIQKVVIKFNSKEFN